MGKSWRSEANLECDLVEDPHADESQPRWEAHDRFLKVAQAYFWDWIVNFYNAALTGGFEVKSERDTLVNPFEHYASFKLKDGSEYYATRPFHVHFKLVVHPSSVDKEDLKNLKLCFKTIRFEGMEFSGEGDLIGYIKQLLGVAAWCKSIQRHKITGRRASSPWEPKPNWHKHLQASSNKNK